METAKLALDEATTRLLAAETAAIIANTKYTLAKLEVQKQENERDKSIRFKEMLDAIQTIQLYAIRNGISLGHTMDALTSRLLSA